MEVSNKAKERFARIAIFQLKFIRNHILKTGWNFMTDFMERLISGEYLQESCKNTNLSRTISRNTIV